MQTHLLRRDIKRDGSHINFDEAVCARQDKKQTCAKKIHSRRCENGSLKQTKLVTAIG